MSQQNIAILTLTMVANGTVEEHRVIGFDGAQATVQGQKVMGSAITSADDGESFGITTHGTAIVETGAAIAVGDAIITDAQGRAIPTTGPLSVAAGATPVTSSAANGTILQGATLPEYSFGDALQAAAGTGERIEVLLRR